MDVVLGFLLVVGIPALVILGPVIIDILAELHDIRKMTKDFGRGDFYPSKMSRTLMDKFKALPKENQPFSKQDFAKALIALDTKFGIRAIDRHYDGPWNGHVLGYCNLSKNPGVVHDCDYKQYRVFYEEIVEINKAIADRKHLFELNSVQPSLDSIESMTEALRGESSIIREVTKEVL